MSAWDDHVAAGRAMPAVAERLYAVSRQDPDAPPYVGERVRGREVTLGPLMPPHPAPSLFARRLFDGLLADVRAARRRAALPQDRRNAPPGA